MATQGDVEAAQQIIDQVINQATDTEAAAMLGAIVQRLEISDPAAAVSLRDNIGAYTHELVRLALLEGVRLGKAAPQQPKRGKWLGL